MKKVLFIILWLLFIDNVYAENILDNYSINVKLHGTKVNITEKFDVINVTDSNYIKESFINLDNYTLVESNIEGFKIVDEQSYHFWPFFTGKIKPNESYIIEYITDFDKFGTGAYSFITPNLTIINNLTFRIEYDKLISSIGVYGYSEGAYEITKDGNIVIGKLAKRTTNANFQVNAWKEELDNKEESVNDKISEKGILDTTIICIVLLLLSGTVLMFFKKL